MTLQAQLLAEIQNRGSHKITIAILEEYESVRSSMVAVDVNNSPVHLESLQGIRWECGLLLMAFLCPS
jgi:hypothetical protein